MTRGNQRDIDRERARRRAERNGANNKKKDEDGLSFQAKKERDAQIMREKQKKKEEAKAGKV
jgi:hypothetical protein